MQLVDIVVSEEVPPILLDMIEVTRVARECITMTSSINASPAQLLRFLVCQVPVIALVKDTVGKRASGANGEQIALETSSVRVYVEDGWALGVRL